MEKHIPNMLSALWALGFFGVLLMLSRLVRPDEKKKPLSYPDSSGDGNSTVSEVQQSPWVRVSARYQVLIVIATMFFLGIILLYPVIATFRRIAESDQGWLALGSVFLFLGTLSVGLAYSRMRGDLSWIRTSRDVKN